MATNATFITVPKNAPKNIIKRTIITPERFKELLTKHPFDDAREKRDVLIDDFLLASWCVVVKRIPSNQRVKVLIQNADNFIVGRERSKIVAAVKRRSLKAVPKSFQRNR